MPLPPVGAPPAVAGADTLFALLDLIHNPDDYKKRVDLLTQMTNDANDAIKNAHAIVAEKLASQSDEIARLRAEFQEEVAATRKALADEIEKTLKAAKAKDDEFVARDAALQERETRLQAQSLSLEVQKAALNAATQALEQQTAALVERERDLEQRLERLRAATSVV